MLGADGITSARAVTLAATRNDGSSLSSFIGSILPVGSPWPIHAADGARLTHSHERQYAFVLQSLMLWREIANDMFRLW